MFNHSDYGMAQAQQERMVAQVDKQEKRAGQPHLLVALLLRLARRPARPAETQLSRRPVRA